MNKSELEEKGKHMTFPSLPFPLLRTMKMSGIAHSQQAHVLIEFYQHDRIHRDDKTQQGF